MPAVTCSSQATMLTGVTPARHGIVGNGWYNRDSDEVRFWQQSHRLIREPLFYQRYQTAKMFWWFNGAPPAKYFATPKPHYGSDGSKKFDIIDGTGCDLTRHLGPFPFFSFWGPAAGLPSSRWIAEATARVMRTHRPEVTLVYLPHLDYDHQRLTDPPTSLVGELDACVDVVLRAADDIGAEPIVVSEYGLRPVSRPVHLNRVLREHGYLTVRDGPFGEQLWTGRSRAFAVADHQIAHVYVADPSDRDAVGRLLRDVDGVAEVLPPEALGLAPDRAGDLIALTQRDSWFTYYYWFDDDRAPDYARTVDIHRKPGYDPVELFATSKIRAAARIAQKKLGFRYRMDVIPLDAQKVGGSHGLPVDDERFGRPMPQHGPLVIGQGDLPESMTGFADYVHRRMDRR